MFKITDEYGIVTYKLPVCPFCERGSNIVKKNEEVYLCSICGTEIKINKGNYKINIERVE